MLKMKIRISVLLYFVIIFNIHLGFSQKLHYELPENAGRLFNSGNYTKAKELYREHYKKNMLDISTTYHFGVCMIHTFEPENGIKMLEKITQKPACPNEVWYHLAKGYHYILRFDKAIELYQKFLKNNSNPVLNKEATRSIEMCENAKKLIKTPLNVTFENLGENVNSKGKDFLPYITDMESYLIFTTRREGTTGKVYDLEENYTADIYHSKFKTNAWSKASSIGFPNSYGNEQTAGISENGDIIFYYVNNPDSKNNLQIAEKTKSAYKKSVSIKEKFINTKESEQISATVSNSKDLMIFSSNISNGKGGFDLYFSNKLPNGSWSAPQNIGNEINTPFNENYPYLSNNGKTLYFASEGHSSIGGYDIFKSEYNENTKTWGAAENIGYPINTPWNDYSICFNSQKNTAYISAYRKDSYGEYDIYKVTFNDESPQLTTLKGNLVNQDSVVFNQPHRIEVFNSVTGDLQGIYENKTKGNFIMILPVGKYELLIDVFDNKQYKQKIEIKGRKQYKSEINQNIQINFTDTESMQEDKK